MKENPEITEKRLTTREADKIIQEFLSQSKGIAKRTKHLRKAFMRENEIPKGVLREREGELNKKGVPRFASKIFALSQCIDETIYHKN